MVLYAVDVFHVQLILEVAGGTLRALLRQEVAMLLIRVVWQVQLDGILQCVGIGLRQVGTEVPYLVVHDIQ